MNAILNKNSTDVKGCTVGPPAANLTGSWLGFNERAAVWQIYVALFPCNECAKLIIQVTPIYV